MATSAPLALGISVDLPIDESMKLDGCLSALLLADQPKYSSTPHATSSASHSASGSGSDFDLTPESAFPPGFKFDWNNPVVVAAFNSLPADLGRSC